MANLGNTIINGALRVNGKINSSDVISAPSFVGAGETLTGHLYLNGITSNTTASTTKIIFGNPTTQYAVIRANDSKTLVFANSLTDNSLAIEYIPSQTAFRPVTSASLDLGSNNNKWKNVYANTFVGALSGNASSATKLATARTINGVSFDGSANITVTDSTKLPLAGGTMTGTISSALNGNWLQGHSGERAIIKSTTTGNLHTALWSKATTNGRMAIYGYQTEMGFSYESQTDINASTNFNSIRIFMDERGSWIPRKR